jgi:hypothetical protein
MATRTPNGSPAGRLLRTAAGTLVGAALMAGGPAAAAHDPDEFSIKAAFVYNFAKFATWPPAAFAGPQAPLVLCTIGEVSFGMALSALHGKPVGERSLAVREATPAGAHACHLLVVGQPQAARVGDLAAALKGRPVLTIGDADGFARRGGAIGLVVENSRVRFEVNPRAVEGSGVTLSSQLLRLARIVEGAS